MLILLGLATTASAAVDPALPVPADLRLQADDAAGTVTLTWALPGDAAAAAYSFNVYVDGELALTVADTQATLATAAGLIDPVYQVTTLLGDDEGLPATASSQDAGVGNCEVLSINIIPPGANPHIECLPDLPSADRVRSPYL